jgi:ATP-binding cassette subfamily F protein 3
LGSFGLGGRPAVQKIATLSGGQKTRFALNVLFLIQSRLVLATLTWQRPHILVLDEPTNHLDYRSVEALISGLKEFKGAVIAVSHDQNFIQELYKDLYIVEKGKIFRWEGEFEDYVETITPKLED